MTRIGDSTSLSEWKSHFDVNFFSLITATRAALPWLKKNSRGGRIVFVSSGAAVKGTAGWGPYNASKAAMNSLCRWVWSLLQVPSISIYTQDTGRRGTRRNLGCHPAWNGRYKRQFPIRLAKAYAEHYLLDAREAQANRN